LVNQRRLSFLALFACFFSLGVIGLGAFTRLIDAGLGCPDWPGCYGQLTVPATHLAQKLANLQFPTTPLVAYKAWAEMLHRYFVGALSLFIMIIIGMIFSQKSLRTRANVLLSLGLILLLAYQIMLGRWTVTLQLLPIIVTQHLLGGFLILALLWLVYLTNLHAKHTSFTTTLNPCKAYGLLLLAVMALVILLLQISLGAWTSTNYASFSCPDFPFCKNDQALIWQIKEAFNFSAPIGLNYSGGLLSETARQTIQMFHRLGALTFTSYMLLFIAYAFFTLKSFPAIRKTFFCILGLTLIQLCVGITNVLFKLPLITAISHNLLAALLLLAVITLIYQIRRLPRKNP
jgi:cytochrome c oxidase assembly protein subunit 15